MSKVDYRKCNQKTQQLISNVGTFYMQSCRNFSGICIKHFSHRIHFQTERLFELSKTKSCLLEWGDSCNLNNCLSDSHLNNIFQISNFELSDKLLTSIKRLDQQYCAKRVFQNTD